LATAVSWNRPGIASIDAVAEIEDDIKRYIRAHNKTSKPFQWSASAVSIFKKLTEIPEPSE
jgi:hypothetical protein